MAIQIMTKSYMDLIGVFQGKQAKYNFQILSILFDNGPLTAWEITGKIRSREKVSLHATLTKRLRSLEKKGYLQKQGKFWLLHFKGIIASLLAQKTPKPWSNRWNEIIDEYAKRVEKYSDTFSRATIRIDDITINAVDLLDTSRKYLRTLEDWVELSNYVKNLMQSGVINFDVISNQTLLSVILSEQSHEQIQAFLKDWNIKK